MVLASTLFSLSSPAQEHVHTPAAHGSDPARPARAAAPSTAAMPMRGMYGPYPSAREASGTSWQPEASPMEGLHGMQGPWSLMWHGFVNMVYDHQGGPRGDSMSFSQSMLMGMGQRPLGGGTLGLRAMVSLDPLMGRRGYPLLFQTGETADGRTPLIDRQHPHDLFMELSASYSWKIADNSALFAYVGLPGEPALGPPAFMHRLSAMDSPEAPLTHHWLDSTHITFGVVTAGYVWRTMKLEGSVFNGREPDQSRWNIELRQPDSASARLSWNPTPAWSLQASHGRLDSPEILEPDVSLRRTTASASYQHGIGRRPAQTMLAWGRNRKQPGLTTDGWLLESSWKLSGRSTLFARFERVENDELFQEDEALHGQGFLVRKLSLGLVHDFARIGHARVGIGLLVSRYRASNALNGIYGSNPSSYMVFLRAKLE